MTPWRNGSASDSRSEGCVFESRRGQIHIFIKYFLLVNDSLNTLFDILLSASFSIKTDKGKN